MAYTHLFLLETNKQSVLIWELVEQIKHHHDMLNINAELGAYKAGVELFLEALNGPETFFPGIV